MEYNKNETDILVKHKDNRRAEAQKERRQYGSSERPRGSLRNHPQQDHPQSGTYVAPIDLELMEMEQFARFTLEKELLNHIRGRLTGEQERAYRLLIEQYRVLESHPEAENRETRMLDLDNAFHRRAFELCGMEGHFDHMLSTFQHIERLRKFSLQTDENKSVCGAHTRILEAVLHGTEEDVSRALSEHLHRYKLSVDQARAAHPDYFIGNGDTW